MERSDSTGEILDLQGAAALLGFSTPTMARLAKQYGLGRKLGREWRFTRRQLMAFLEGLNSTTREPPPGSFIELLDALSVMTGNPPRPDVTRFVGALSGYLLTHGQERAAPAVEILAGLLDSRYRQRSVPRRSHHVG
jgi:hypothetical protein